MINKPINIRADVTNDNLVGKSHMWGAPDLPANMPYPYVMVQTEDGEEYPEPLPFVAQIRLADIAHLDAEGLLPHTGMLYVFAAIDYFLGNDTPLETPMHGEPGDLVKVLYSEEEEGLEPYELHWEGTDESVFMPPMALQFTCDNSDDYSARMLGLPFHDEVADEFPNHVVLFQIEEDDRVDLRFFDCGSYYILARPDDLRRRDFNRISTSLFTY